MNHSIFFQVHWFQQQHERRRLKRDYQYISPQWIPSVSGASPEITPPVHRTRYRALGAQNIFPDPLFKEQWYLVSNKFIDKKNLTTTVFCRY